MESTYETVFELVPQTISVRQRRATERSPKTGHWLQVTPSHATDTILTAGQFRDALQLRYGSTPDALPRECDGCGKEFTVNHGLDCRVGGLVSQRHDAVRDELGALATLALAPSAVRREPLIQYCGRQQENDEAHVASTTAPAEARGDLLVKGLWGRLSQECIIDVRVTNLDAASQATRDAQSVLTGHEKAKKRQYAEACKAQRRVFTPFIMSVDGMVGDDANALLKQLAKLIAEKTTRPVSETTNYVRTRISLAAVRTSHLCLRGARTRCDAHPFRPHRPGDTATFCALT